MDIPSRRTWRSKASGSAVIISLTLSCICVIGLTGRDTRAATPAATTPAQQADNKIPFDIPAGDARKTLLQFYLQSQVQVLYLSETVHNIKTQAVQGELTPAEALKKMLAGTGLVFEFETQGSAVVMAANKASSPRPTRPAGTGTPESSEEDPAMRTAQTERSTSDSLDEVVVTGSYLHGIDEIVSPLIIVAEKDKKQAAYGTVQDVLRTLPSVFGGSPSEDANFTGGNFNRGTGVNLRGLGAGATLVLVNGRRQPVSGIDGDFVDVSTIPWSAVERIEVLPDGASALYGSDAVAGVVNIIMRDDLIGSETQARLGQSIGGADETLVAQLFGHHWNSGKLLLAYQYSKRTALSTAERDYAANADKRPFGGTDHRTYLSNPGNILDPMTLQPAFGIPFGQDGRSLTADQLLRNTVNLHNQREGYDLLVERATHSTYLSVSQKIGENFELFAEGRFNRRSIDGTQSAYDQVLVVPSSNPFFVDPFGGLPFVIVAYNFGNEFGPLRGVGVTKTYAGTLGAKLDITDQWQATFSAFQGTEEMQWAGYNLVDFIALDQKLADPDPNTAFNPFGSGSNTHPETLEAIRRTQRERAVSKIRSANFIIDGSLPSLPMGTPKLAVGMDYRDESLNRNIPSSQYERSTVAGFSELSLPITRSLDLSVAARYESYSDFGDTFNPKIGLRWAPMKSLRLRSSWATAFRAPTLVDLYDRSLDFAGLVSAVDSLSPSGQVTTVLIRTGTNSQLHEETAITRATGVDFAPSAIPGFTLSSTYYIIDYKDQVWRPRPPLTIEALISEPQWASLITRSPALAEVEAICSSPIFLGTLSDCIANPPAVILDARVRNLSATTVKGIDLELKQSLETSHGDFNFGFNGNYLLKFSQAVTQAAPAIDIEGTALNPPSLKLRATSEWHQHGQNQAGLGLSFAVNHLSAAKDDSNPLDPHVDSLTTLDFQVRYRTAKSDNWLGNVELVLNAVNVFNTDPPFLDRVEGYDFINADPYSRVISLSVQKNW